MSDMGKMRREQRRAAKEGPKPQATDPTPLEQAIERALAKNARVEATPDTDAKAIAMIVVKHWGDDAPKVMRMATEFTRDEVGRWAPATPSNSAPGGSRGRGEGETP